MNHRIKLLILLFSLSILTSVSATGCRSTGTEMEISNIKMAPLPVMPDQVRSAPVIVQQAYQFAAANPEILAQIPCYCGCGAMGHTSNFACYFNGANFEEPLAFDPHALGCSICVDITQDSMRLLEQGKTLPEIRTYIDATYAQYGPSNIP